MIKKIISGGQSGVDTAGLQAAKMFGIETGGTMPNKFIRHNDKGEKYSDPDFAKLFGLVEGGIDPSIFRLRTIRNAQDADGTVWFGNADSPGGKLTLGRQCQKGKPTPCVNPTAAELIGWVIQNNIRILNVAGNREYTNPGVSKVALETICVALKKLQGKDAQYE